MITEPLRRCDACEQPLGVIVYDLNAQVSLIAKTEGRRMAFPQSAIVAIQLCSECGAGAKPNALQRALDRLAHQFNMRAGAKIYQLPRFSLFWGKQPPGSNPPPLYDKPEAPPGPPKAPQP